MLVIVRRGRDNRQYDCEQVMLCIMDIKLPKIIVTSVVRGSQQGESHGGIFTVDFESQTADQLVDWNTGDIDFAGRGADRGLRGIVFDGDDIYVAASDELYRYNRDFEIQDSWRNPYLKHCHEIALKDRKIFLTSTGFDSLLVFDLSEKAFNWGFHLLKHEQWSGFAFNPQTPTGPRSSNDHHINMVHVDDTGIYLSGLRMSVLLHLNSSNEVQEVCNLPQGTHNARPYRGGVLFNDTVNDCVRFVSRSGNDQMFPIRKFQENELQYAGIDDSKVARQGFGRGLCVYDGRFVAGGSSPSTISLYDLDTGQTVSSVSLTMDIRNAIHGLEVWPYQ
jgi:hypothetical protein